ncbi:MAG: acetyl-CoA carboxylase biotin carboxyl carrier protein [Firmicutes bacterium]|nr:acetyl-CoA carboxylase biotin carboxyl carrier protein [Bacillota bacterium]
MKEENIRKYAELMNELGLSALEITEDGSKIRLERETAAAVTVPVMQAPAAAAVSNETGASSVLDADIITVTSPMVGVFYAAPTENAEHFVSVGARVKKGDTLCIIEAMKLMNEITAEEDGVVSEICVTNGQVVDFGCDLFKIKRL